MTAFALTSKGQWKLLSVSWLARRAGIMENFALEKTFNEAAIHMYPRGRLFHSSSQLNPKNSTKSQPLEDGSPITKNNECGEIAVVHFWLT